MSWLDLITPAILLPFMGLELVLPAQGAHSRWAWRRRAIAVSTVNFGLLLGLGHVYDHLFGGIRLLDGRALGTWGGAVVGVVVYDLLHYGYHRAAHRFDFLWRLGHQMHHLVRTALDRSLHLDQNQ